MQLQQVSYQVFAHDLKTLWGDEAKAWHQLDGEIMLTFADRSQRFISWGSEPIAYCLNQGTQSFFKPGALHAVDVSQHPYWQSLMRQELELHFIDQTQQVLHLKGKHSELYLTAQYRDGSYLGDCMRVSPTKPF